MAEPDELGRGRDAFAGRRWSEAYTRLSAAEPESPADLERLALAAYLLGKEAEAIAAWQRAHQALLEQGEVEGAARAGFWLSFILLLGGEGAQATGWFARVQRLVADQEEPRVEQGYVDVLLGLLTMGKGDNARAADIFAQVIACAGRCGEADLMALGLLGRGQAIIHGGDVARGIESLDEAMVSVTAGEVSPIVAGIVYCAVIASCEGAFDPQRAREWTAALDGWCASQPDLVAFRTPCLVHRSEIMRLRGEWHGALEEARRASERTADRKERLAGRALYQRGEIHRLRGEFDRAEEMYRECARRGHEPQPGASLLRLARGDVAAAATAIRRALAEVGGGSLRASAVSMRARLLGPYVEIMLAAGEGEAARRAADELDEIAAALGAPLLRATSAQARGAVLLTDGDAQAALAALRLAWTHWQQLEAPYEAACARVLLADACERLGDRDSAAIHLDSARAVFERLGAAADLSRLEGSSKSATPRDGSPLTSREREVLKLVATGKTNRQIAASLELSEHTVARHLSNIFNKLGVASRTAASAYAFEHDSL